MNNRQKSVSPTSGSEKEPVISYGSQSSLELMRRGCVGRKDSGSGSIRGGRFVLAGTSSTVGGIRHPASSRHATRSPVDVDVDVDVDGLTMPPAPSLVRDEPLFPLEVPEDGARVDAEIMRRLRAVAVVPREDLIDV